MNSAQLNHFENNPVALDISRSIFNRDCSHLYSADVGECIPNYIAEIYPGDTVKMQTSKVIRLQPLVTPLFGTVWYDQYFFFIPNRLIWSHWEEFMGENKTTAWTPTTSYNVPKIKVPSGGFDVGTIADYLGIAPKEGAAKEVSVLPLRAYALTMDQWFRSEPLMNPVHVHVDDTTRTGVNTGDQVTDIELGGTPFIACRLVDYFSSCLPSAQRASGPMVEFALNGLLPVNAYKTKTNIVTGEAYSDFGSLAFKTNYDTSSATPSVQALKVDSYGGLFGYGSTSGTGTSEYLTPSNLFADLNNTSIFDINSLRQAFAIQRYYEKTARAGGRYIEQIRAFFGTSVPDYRLQRVEYLGGNRIPLQISSEYQQSATATGLTPQGNPVGISHTGDVHEDFVKSFSEHGFLLGIGVVRYEHLYQDSVERFWFRDTLFSYYNPTFANLGEMEVLENEIYFNSTSNGAFGFQEAWADLRTGVSRVSGQMRSVDAAPLDMWHLGDHYTSQPYLSDSWIREDKTNLDRCLAVTSAVSNQYMADIYFNAEFSRAMPLYSIPGLIDHH